MNSGGTAAYYTLGCKLNFAETSTIARDLSEHGFARVDFETGADLYVINTCSVTDRADRKCRTTVRRALKYNPDAYVVVIGCYAQLKPEEISRIPGVDVVLGANEKFNVAGFLNDLNKRDSGLIEAGRIGQVREFNPSFSHGDRTRSFLKIQDGCDYFCSFCTIPLARGKSRNATIEETITKAKEVRDLGAKEVVLTGVNIGDFGQGGEENFYRLIQELDKVDGIERFRISSIEPNLLSNDIIDFVQSSNRFVPHFHIPLQSGSDELLTSMKRKYNRNLYTNRIRSIRASMPNACIGVDVIVGYPGETDAHFEETYDYLKDLDVSYLHVFTYSERNKTVAPKLEGNVPMEVRQERSKRLRSLSEKLKRAFYEPHAGTEHEVLWESEEEEGMMFGFTRNYLRVRTQHSEGLVNTTTMVMLGALNADCIFDCVEVGDLVS